MTLGNLRASFLLMELSSSISPTPQGLSLNDPSDSQFHPRGHSLDHCRIHHLEFLKIMRKAFLFASYGVLIRFSYCLTVLLLTCPPNGSHMELFSALNVTCCGVFSCAVLFTCMRVCAWAHRAFRGQLGRVSSGLPPLGRFWRSHSGHWACTARTFTHNPSCLPHMLICCSFCIEHFWGDSLVCESQPRHFSCIMSPHTHLANPSVTWASFLFALEVRMLGLLWLSFWIQLYGLIFN